MQAGLVPVLLEACQPENPVGPSSLSTALPRPVVGGLGPGSATGLAAGSTFTALLHLISSPLCRQRVATPALLERLASFLGGSPAPEFRQHVLLVVGRCCSEPASTVVGRMHL